MGDFLHFGRHGLDVEPAGGIEYHQQQAAGKHEQGEGSERAFAGLDHLVRLTKPPESGTPIVPGSPRPGKDRTAGA